MIVRRIILPVLLTVILSMIAGWFWLLHTESGARFAWQRAAVASEGMLTAQSLEGDLSSGLRIGQAEIVAGGAHTKIDSLLLAVNVDLLPVVVTLEVLRINDVIVILPDDQDTGQRKVANDNVVPDIALPFQLTVPGAEVSNIHIVNAAEAPVFIVDRVSFGLDWKERLHVSDLQVIAAEPQFTIVGEIAGTAERLDIALSASPYGVSLAANIRDLRSAQITSIDVDHLEISADGSAVVSWHDDLDIVAELAIARANVAAFTDQWPAGHPVSADLAIEYRDARVAINESKLLVSGTDTTLLLDGELDLETGDVVAEIDWNRLQWPIAVAEPQVRSDKGKIDVRGTVEDWRVDGRLQLAAAGVEDGVLTISGGGDDESLEINIVDGQALGGSLSGSVAWSWVVNDRWAAALDLVDIQLKALIPELPATLDGHIELAPEKIVARDVLMTHGQNFVRANGDVFSAKGVAFELEIDDIGRYRADAAGAVTAAGALSLVNDNPFLRINGASDRLSYGGVKLIDVSIRDVAENGDVLATQLTVSELDVAGERIRDVIFDAQVRRELQSLELAFVFGDIRSTISMGGEFDHWDSPSQWRGQVTNLEVLARDFEPVVIDAPTDILLATDHLELAELCVRATSDASVCASFAWLSGERLDVNASFDRIPIDIVNDFRETGFTFDQLLAGNVTWHRVTGERPTGDADIRLSAGNIHDDEQPEFGVTTEEGVLSFHIVNGTLLAGELSLPMPGTGNITGFFEATDVAAGLSSRIEGGIDANVADIGIAAAFSPLIDQAGGELIADFDFSGTLQDPEIVGRVDVNGAQINYQPLGLVLTDVEIQAEFDDERQITVDGSFRAGDGTAEFQTSAAYAATDATGIELRVRGDDLLIINVPDVQAVADADLSLSYENNVLQIGGSLNVPRMHIAPQNLSSASAVESVDVVIVAGELPYQEADESSPLSIFGDLSVALGPQVVIDLGVAEANVAGETVFTWNGDPMPMANGRYDLSGDISAFGQVLTIKDGGVRFANVPADDPYVRLRAERQIYGNSQVKRAGVLVEGRLTRPSFEAYTSPPTTEERALTLLVTGSDFDYESGAGAIDFGTYIAPKLFVSYGVGIFERDNVISARYDLTRGFGIKATSGQKESGFDFIYSHEN